MTTNATAVLLTSSKGGRQQEPASAEVSGWESVRPPSSAQGGGCAGARLSAAVGNPIGPNFGKLSPGVVGQRTGQFLEGYEIRDNQSYLFTLSKYVYGSSILTNRIHHNDANHTN